MFASNVSSLGVRRPRQWGSAQAVAHSADSPGCGA
eukprot:gene23138-29331_t